MSCWGSDSGSTGSSLRKQSVRDHSRSVTYSILTSPPRGRLLLIEPTLRGSPATVGE